MNLFAVSGLSVGVACVILSVITLFFGETKLHRKLLFFNIAVAIWGAGLYMVGIANTESKAIFGWKFAHLGGFFIAPLFYHLVCTLTKIKRKKLLYFAYLQAIIITPIGLVTELVFNKTRFVYDVYFNEANSFYSSGVIFYLLFVMLSYYELFKFLPKTRGHKRRQTLYIIFGFMMGFLGGTSTFLPMFRIDIIHPVGNFGITVYVVVLTYAILRYQLMDVHLVLKKSLVYSISAGILTGFFILLVLTTTKLLSDYAGTSSFAIIVISALVIAVFFNPLKNRIQLFIDKTFYKTSYNYYTVIQKVSHELALTIDLKYIYKFIVETVFTTLKVKSTYFLSAKNEHFEVVYSRLFKNEPSDENVMSNHKIYSESQLIKLLKNKDEIYFKEELSGKAGHEKAEIITEELKSFAAEVIAPIFIDNELTFLLIIGGKLSTDIFSDEDINLLSTLTHQVAIALRNAKLYDELERRVEEKTEELRKSQAQLVQSDKLSAIGQLAAGLAHELNSPLTGLLALIKKYREKASRDSVEYRHMTLMFSSCEHMAKIVKDFSGFSRRAESEYVKVNLLEVIEYTLGLVIGQLKQKNIQLTKRYTDGLPEVKGDKIELQQVVLNIVTNAIDAMDDGGSLVIETGISGDGSKVTMGFIDSGCGIRKEDLGRIFDPFFTRKAYGDGVGLGLSVSYRIVKNHGGEIVAESDPAKGTKFTVSLPVMESKDGG